MTVLEWKKYDCIRHNIQTNRYSCSSDIDFISNPKSYVIASLKHLWNINKLNGERGGKEGKNQTLKGSFFVL